MAEYMIGTITLFSGIFTPKDFYECDGRILLIKENVALYSIIGNKYGGDGNATFKLPQLQAPNDMKYIICYNGLYPERE